MRPEHVYMPKFGKKVNCPPSPLVLAFQQGDATARKSRLLARHLERCEFCSCEVDFYRRFPPVEESVESPDIPRPLLELAESILRKDELDQAESINGIVTV